MEDMIFINQHKHINKPTVIYKYKHELKYEMVYLN